MLLVCGKLSRIVIFQEILTKFSGNVSWFGQSIRKLFVLIWATMYSCIVYSINILYIKYMTCDNHIIICKWIDHRNMITNRQSRQVVSLRTSHKQIIMWLSRVMYCIYCTIFYVFFCQVWTILLKFMGVCRHMKMELFLEFILWNSLMHWFFEKNATPKFFHITKYQTGNGTGSGYCIAPAAPFPSSAVLHWQ